MGRGRTCGSAGSWTVVLGAVIIGCAFFVPAVGAAAGITVEIIKPDKDPVVFDAGKEHEFEAVAFVEGQELPGGSVTWDWNFGDGTDHSAANPTTHTYAARGSYHVVVTATYGALSGQAARNVQAAWAGSEDAIKSFVTEFRYGSYDGPVLSGQVSDFVSIVVRQKDATPYWVGVRWCRDGLFLYPGQSWEINWGYIDGEYCRFASFPWSTADKHNGLSSAWQAEVAFEVSPPPGQEEPCVETVLLPAMTASPLNMVIHAGGPLIIDHKAGTAAETLTWSSIHLDNPTAGVPRVYDALVRVFSLSGAEIDRGTAQFTINQQASWDWHPNLGGPPEGGDSDGLYTFLVTSSGSVEDMDTDKVDMLSGVDNASESDKMHIDWDTLTLKGKIRYTAAGELASPVLHIYGPSPTEIGLPTSAGTHEVPYEVPIGYGTFHAVITATQTAAQAANNRDEVAKPVLPKGCWLGSIPGPPGAVEITEPDLDPATDNHVAFDGSAPGQCVFAANGIVKDTQGNRLQGLEGGLSWTLDSIAGSTLTTVPAPPKAPNPQFTYETLPSSNGEFGSKTLTLSHPLVTSPDTQYVEVFFPGGARNHPGGGHRTGTITGHRERFRNSCSLST